jgi:hypothetical protein
MSKDYPLGVGGQGFHTLSPQYIPAHLLTEGTRAAHSTWIKTLVEYGYIGLTIYIGYLFSSFHLSRKVRAHLLEKKYHYLFLQNVSLCSSFIALVVASTFMDRLYAELTYWMPAFMACYYNIYKTKGYSEEELLKINIFKGK